MSLKDYLDTSKPGTLAKNSTMFLKGKKNIVLFGAAEYGKIICDYLNENDIYPTAYFDNSIQKQNTIWNGLSVLSPEKISKNAFVVITCNAYREVRKQLIAMGICEDSIYFFNVNWITNPNGKQEYILNNINSFSTVFERLADEKSKKVFKNLLNYKMTYKDFYIEEIADENQYFDEELFSFPEDVTFVDAGCYVGDTLDSFLKFTKGSFGRVICLDPVDKNIEATVNYIKKHNIKNADVFRIALSDTKKVMYFESQNNMAARVNENGSERIECDSIDNICKEKGYEKIDFIKMDIEGAEIEAINGARETIKKYKPILAICVYHKEDDFYTIPNLINAIEPSYDLYFRHYELSDEETVCFAIPKR